MSPDPISLTTEFLELKECYLLIVSVAQNEAITMHDMSENLTLIEVDPTIRLTI